MFFMVLFCYLDDSQRDYKILDILKVRHIPIVVMVLSSFVFLIVSTSELITLSKTASKFVNNIFLLFPVLMVLGSYLTYDQTDIILQDYAGLVFLA